MVGGWWHLSCLPWSTLVIAIVPWISPFEKYLSTTALAWSPRSSFNMEKQGSLALHLNTTLYMLTLLLGWSYRRGLNVHSRLRVVRIAWSDSKREDADDGSKLSFNRREGAAEKNWFSGDTYIVHHLCGIFPRSVNGRNSLKDAIGWPLFINLQSQHIQCPYHAYAIWVASRGPAKKYRSYYLFRALCPLRDSFQHNSEAIESSCVVYACISYAFTVNVEFLMRYSVWMHLCLRYCYALSGVWYVFSSSK